MDDIRHCFDSTRVVHILHIVMDRLSADELAIITGNVDPKLARGYALLGAVRCGGRLMLKVQCVLI